MVLQQATRLFQTKNRLCSAKLNSAVNVANIYPRDWVVIKPVNRVDPQVLLKTISSNHIVQNVCSNRFSKQRRKNKVSLTLLELAG